MMQTATVERIAAALGSTPTAAYTAPHDYPHAAPFYQPLPCGQRERVHSKHLRLYVHIPFCNYACSFCCYARKVGVEIAQKRRYVRTLKRELEWVEPGTPVSQFFVGGGTPTALPAELLDEVLEAIVTRMPFHGGHVHTVETSPESVTTEHLNVLSRRGVERVSMGIQSMEEDVLDTVRRGHNQQGALEACRLIVDAGFILNIDLMYGLPDQDEDGFRRDFELAAEQGVHSVTAYNLRLNEYTPLARNMAIAERFDLAKLIRWRAFVRDTALDLGFAQTRWHTFKRMDSKAVRHERVQVAGADMRGFQLGIGMSARSSLGHKVYRNHKGLTTYMERVEAGLSPVEEVFPLLEEDLKTQFVARSLGDGKSLRFDAYERTFDSPFTADFGPTLMRLQWAGLIDMDGAQIILTDTGKLVYDLVTLAFYPPRAKEWLLEHIREYQLTDAQPPPPAFTPMTLASQ